MSIPELHEAASSRRTEMIGPYRVITTIGVGGMAEVLKVEDTRTGQARALKIHHMPTTDEDVLLRYRREVRAIARCDHPNVIKIFDYGNHNDRPYLVMEFVPGVHLTDFLEERGLSPGPERDKIAALLAMQLASALEHVHSRNLVHRDIKPENILVTSDEIVKLIDFGIARDLGQDVEMETEDSGDVIGTYAFCSPEQVSGIPVDHRSDLYSFGVVFYLLLTNHLPFVAEEAVAFVLKHVSEAPEPPENYYPEIPSALRDITLQLLEKKPVDRPPSGRDVQLVLKGYVDRMTRELRLSSFAAFEQGLSSSVQGTRLFEPAFVGREREQAQLEGAISLLQGMAGGVALVEGEIGLGKARLMDMAMADARARGIAVYTARCLPAADMPYQGILELILALVKAIPDEGIPDLQTKLGGYLPILARAFPPVERLLPPDTPPVADADPRIELERIRLALRAFLQAVIRGPTVLALRDLQWADHATMSLIASVSRDFQALGDRSVAILWLASVSTDELSSEHALRSWLANPPPHVQVVKVQPLDVEEVETLVKSMLGGNLDLGLMAIGLHRETRGNPLFIAEAVRGLAEAGGLQPHLHDDGEITGWTLLGGAGSRSKLVQTVRDTLAARFAALSKPTQEMLERIAVLARPCSYEWLRVATGLPEEPLLDLLDEVIARRLLVERKGYRRSVFAFLHPKMSEVIIERLSDERRAQLHREAAEAWKNAHGDTDNASAEILAHHLFEGGDYERAAPYLLRAAEARLRLGLNEAALRLLDQGLKCDELSGNIDSRMVATFQLRLGTILHELGNADRAWGLLRSSYKLSKLNNYRDLQGQALYVLARVTAWRGDFATSCKHYAEAMKIQRDCRDHAGLLRSLNGLAGSLWYLGDLPRSRRLFEESAASARKVGEPGPMSHAIAGLGLVAAHEGRFSDAATYFMEASVLSRSGGRDSYYLRCQLNEAEVRTVQGDLGTARALAALVVEKLERIEERDSLASGYNIRALIALEIRDLSQTRTFLMKSGENLARSPHLYERAVRQFYVGVLEMARGRPVEAQLGLTEALNLAETHQYRELVARVHRYMGVSHLQCGSPGEGLSLLRQAMEESDRLSNLPGHVEGKLFYAEGLLVQGEREEAQAILEQVVSSARDMGMRMLLVRSTVLLGRLAFDSGLHTQARSLLEESLGQARDIRAGLAPEERKTFDSRPEIRLLGALWRSLPAPG